VSGRRRTVLLALLALATPLPAFALEQGALESAPAPGPAGIQVSASLDSCGVLDDGVVCKIDVSFNSVPDADTYSATVTRADGSVIDYGSVGAGGASVWVPYVGSGNYSVRITAYAAPDPPAGPDDQGEVIATGYTRSTDDADEPEDREPRDAPTDEVEAEATGRDTETYVNPDPDGAATSEVEPAAAAPAPPPTCTPPDPPAPPTPPVEPPPDLDPENLDEDADGIPDDQERITYEQQLAEYQAAVAAQVATPAPTC